MPEQRELLLAFPELAPEAPLIPVRMVNEYVYCPRLAYRLTRLAGFPRHACLGLMEANKFAYWRILLYSARTSKQPRLRKFELHLSLTPPISASFSE